MNRTEIKHQIEEYQAELQSVRGDTPAAEGLRAAIQDDIDRLQTKLEDQ